MSQKLNSFLYILATLFFLIILYEINSYGSNIPVNDYWEGIKISLGADNKISAVKVFETQNHHLQLLPKIIYYLNIKFFAGNDFVLKYITIFFVLIQIALLYKMARETLDCSYKRAISFVFITFYSFTPLAIDSFSYGYSGTHWILANLMAVLTLYCFYHRKEKPTLYLPILILSGGIAATSHSTGIMVLPALILVYFLAYRPPFKYTLIIAILGVLVVSVCALFVFNVFENPPTEHISNIFPVIFFGVIMSGISAGNAAIAALLGSCILFFMFKISLNLNNSSDVREKEVQLFWIGVAIYCLFCIIAFGFARIDTGGASYVQYSRYQSLPALLLISAFILFIKNKSINSKILIISAVIASMSLTYNKGVSYFNLYRYSQELNDLNRYSLAIEEDFAYNFFISGLSKDEMAKTSEKSVAFLNEYKNIPYNPSKWNMCEQVIHSKSSIDANSSDMKVKGHLVDIKWDHKDSWNPKYKEIIIDGSASEPWECLLVVNKENDIIGAGQPAKYMFDFLYDSLGYEMGQSLYRLIIPNDHEAINIIAFDNVNKQPTSYPLVIE
ncbi:MAG: hypothetical protein PQ612_08405 [Rickettsiales bacterium]|nr:hypothetical protein [Pseudomonadota bacterium]MDA0966757.1 hypothetical protein [Pseudomonadota bacterium]MDG4543429.1 hypothetical protein [Rickettsiales bacterium]MDG4546177.1 hypothetical protein [Rickettsiales bacterium]MDG4547650.1 hypothetical protein [Rickettsiales bacterium]